MSQPYRLPCGTHTGHTLQQILEQDPAYLEQCVKTALLIEQLPAMQSLLPCLSSDHARPPVSPPRNIATVDIQTNSSDHLIDLSGPELLPHSSRTTYNDLRDLMLATPAPHISSTSSGYGLGRSDTPDAVQQLHILYPDASSTAIHLIYQMLPIYPSLTMDTLCIQCGQPFSRHQGLSCPTLLTGAFIPSTTTLAHRV
jgi:hypothetical protein